MTDLFGKFYITNCSVKLGHWDSCFWS